MNLFQNVKYGVNCREAAERYGVSVNRQGKALCPFHNDRHPSLYVADDHYADVKKLWAIHYNIYEVQHEQERQQTQLRSRKNEIEL